MDLSEALGVSFSQYYSWLNTSRDRGEEDQGGKDGCEREVISFDIYIDIVMCLNSNSRAKIRFLHYFIMISPLNFE